MKKKSMILFWGIALLFIIALNFLYNVIGEAIPEIIKIFNIA